MYSKNYKTWVSIPDPKRCINCKNAHGKIYLINEEPDPKPPLHPKCRCYIDKLQSLYAGEATIKGGDGVDWWLKYNGTLPDYYITNDEAENLGYIKWLGNLHIIAPNKMLFKGEYQNRNRHLPHESGRVWYEADINYTGGYRNRQRIVFSNDGLIFVTYDHYMTFIEIV